MKKIIQIVFLIFFLSCNGKILPKPILPNEENLKSKTLYTVITETNINGLYFHGGINDIMYHAWTLYAGKVNNLLTEEQINNFCEVLTRLDKGAYYVSSEEKDGVCWSRDNYVIVAWTLFKLQDNVCASKALVNLLDKVTKGASLCGASMWLPEYLGYFDRLRGEEDTTLAHIYDLALLTDVKIQAANIETSTKILLWPVVRLGVEIYQNYATTSAYEEYQKIDIGAALTTYYLSNPDAKMQALGELLKGVLK